jgi:hypothetical protein
MSSGSIHANGVGNDNIGGAGWSSGPAEAG